MEQHEIKGGRVVVLPKQRSNAGGDCKGQPVLGIIDDPPSLSHDGKRVLVRWGHISDNIDVFAIADLTVAQAPAGSGTAKMYADITPQGELLQVYSDPDKRGSWALARYCKDWGVPRDISYGCAPVDLEIAEALGYRWIEVGIEYPDPLVFVVSGLEA